MPRRLIRFLAAGKASVPVIGEPVDANLDVGLAVRQKSPVWVNLYSGSSILEPGQRLEVVVEVERLLSPLSRDEVGTIRCIGLNYVNHAKEVNLPLPDIPTVFHKPATTLLNPWPSFIEIPREVHRTDAADYEAELAFVIAKDAKDVSESNAMSYVLGYTAANDVSSRLQQFAQSQWCYSKSFDTSCPIGPAFIFQEHVEDFKSLAIEGLHNGKTVQSSTMSDLIFSIPRIVSFLSQGTTLPRGTLVLTGTPAGVGWSATPRRTLRDGDEFRVHISHGIGSLINEICVQESR